MELIVVKLKDHLAAPLQGIYGANKVVPDRFLFAHPDLARAILAMERDGLRLVYSDLFRSAAASLARRKAFEAAGSKQLAARPGESPHNFALAIDIDVAASMKAGGFKSKKAFDSHLATKYGLYCHRVDGKLAAEAWHFNALGPDAGKWLPFASSRSTSRAIEAKIVAIYGEAFKLTRDEQIFALRSLGHLGKETTTAAITAAIKSFQKAWGLAVDGLAGPKTQRLLSYLTATMKIVDP